ncbi:MAG TPA: hypothetical protein VGF56_00795 [Rhizomicrobium sp.]|jgi:general secretion pathway protein K
MALASVLWGMAALSLIAAAMLSSSMNAVHVARNSWTQLRADAEADSAVQLAILSLFDPRMERRLPVDGSTEQLTVNGDSVAVSIQDEAGRIDVNYASRNFLRDLFKAAGASASDADTLSDRIVDWRSVKGTHSLNGATADDYRNAGYAYVPRGGAFQSVDEAGLVMGMTPELFARVAPALTVYSHSPFLDMRIGTKQALMAIPGMDADKADVMVSARGSGSFAVASYFAVANPAGRAFTITANAAVAGAHALRKAVIMVSGDPAHPVMVLDWK